MSTENGQFLTKDGKSRGTGPQGEQNPLLHVPLGSPPTPPNQPETREAPSYSLPAELTNDPNRQVLWKAEDHPRWHSPDVYKREKDPGHENEASRSLSGPPKRMTNSEKQ